MVDVWYSVPKEITISKEKAKKCYSEIAFNQIPKTLDNGYDTTGIPNTEERVILRGAKKNVINLHTWYYSTTFGGYVEAVILRYLRIKYNNDFSMYSSIEDLNLRDIVKVLGKKYSMERNTRVAVLKNIRNELFEYSSDNPLYY